MSICVMPFLKKIYLPSNPLLSNAFSSKTFQSIEGGGGEVEYLVLAMNGSVGGGRGWAGVICCVKRQPRVMVMWVVGGPAVVTWAAGGPVVSEARPCTGERAVLLRAATSSKRWWPASCSSMQAGGRWRVGKHNGE
jgi:hypothetical protein